MKIKISSQQDLIDFILRSGSIRLSRQDRHFFHSIFDLLYTNQPVTSSQVWLMNTLIDKYDKQLSKYIDTNGLKNLPWGAKIILSDAKYTDGHIEIINDKIYFRCPYNNKFISSLRNSNGNELFVWEKANRRYVADFCSIGFKLIVTLAFNIFNVVHCCPVTKQLIEQLSLYENKHTSYWDPTLVKINNQVMILASNSHIHDYLEKINFDYQVTPKNLATLCRMSVKVDSSLIEHDYDLEFASTYNPIIELKNLDTLPRLLKLIECDMVHTDYDNFYSKHRDELKELLKKENIYMSVGKLMPKSYKFPVMLKFRTTNTFEQKNKYIGKIIQVVNREPINFK